MSGRVLVKYYSAPMVLRYIVGLSKVGLSFSESLGERQEGVETGLA